MRRSVAAIVLGVLTGFTGTNVLGKVAVAYRASDESSIGVMVRAIVE